MAPPASDGAGGVIYTLTFDRYEDANHAWRYSDLTRQVTFTSSALEETIEREMHAEALYPQQHGRARQRMKTLIEGAGRHTRSHHPIRSSISGKLRAEYPILEHEEIAQDVVSSAIIRSAAFEVANGRNYGMIWVCRARSPSSFDWPGTCCSGAG